jgi:hypothetical protein
MLMAKKLAGYFANALLGYAMVIYGAAVLGVIVPYMMSDSVEISPEAAVVVIVGWITALGLTLLGAWFAARS